MNNEQKTIDILKEFLLIYPELYNSRSKTPLSDKEIEKRVKSSFERNIIPSIPKTIPDPLVSLILTDFYEINISDIDKVQKEHQLSMAAENKVGDYLELYISETGHNSNGWVHCIDGMIKAIDFIKKEDNKWELLQVKNRSNSENSSSVKIRKYMKEKYDIDIMKWHRTNANSGKTEWDKFPDKKLRTILNENDFHLFIKKYIENIKKENQEGLLF